MPRRARIAPGEIFYHHLNRANGRSQLFYKPEDYAAFERIMVAAMRRSPIRLQPRRQSAGLALVQSVAKSSWGSRIVAQRLVLRSAGKLGLMGEHSTNRRRNRSAAQVREAWRILRHGHLEDKDRG
jgi:hypothetical protein